MGIGSSQVAALWLAQNSSRRPQRLIVNEISNGNEKEGDVMQSCVALQHLASHFVRHVQDSSPGGATAQQLDAIGKQVLALAAPRVGALATSSPLFAVPFFVECCLEGSTYGAAALSGGTCVARYVGAVIRAWLKHPGSAAPYASLSQAAQADPSLTASVAHLHWLCDSACAQIETVFRFDALESWGSREAGSLIGIVRLLQIATTVSLAAASTDPCAQLSGDWHPDAAARSGVIAAFVSTVGGNYDWRNSESGGLVAAAVLSKQLAMILSLAEEVDSATMPLPAMARSQARRFLQRGGGCAAVTLQLLCSDAAQLAIASAGLPLVWRCVEALTSSLQLCASRIVVDVSTVLVAPEVWGLLSTSTFVAQCLSVVQVAAASSSPPTQDSSSAQSLLTPVVACFSALFELLPSGVSADHAAASLHIAIYRACVAGFEGRVEAIRGEVASSSSSSLAAAAQKAKKSPFTDWLVATVAEGCILSDGILRQLVDSSLETSGQHLLLTTSGTGPTKQLDETYESERQQVTLRLAAACASAFALTACSSAAATRGSTAQPTLADAAATMSPSVQALVPLIRSAARLVTTMARCCSDAPLPEWLRHRGAEGGVDDDDTMDDDEFADVRVELQAQNAARAPLRKALCSTMIVVWGAVAGACRSIDDAAPTTMLLDTYLHRRLALSVHRQVVAAQAALSDAAYRVATSRSSASRYQHCRLLMREADRYPLALAAWHDAWLCENAGDISISSSSRLLTGYASAIRRDVPAIEAAASNESDEEEGGGQAALTEEFIGWLTAIAEAVCVASGRGARRAAEGSTGGLASFMEHALVGRHEEFPDSTDDAAEFVVQRLNASTVDDASCDDDDALAALHDLFVANTALTCLLAQSMSQGDPSAHQALEQVVTAAAAVGHPQREWLACLAMAHELLWFHLDSASAHRLLTALLSSGANVLGTTASEENPNAPRDTIPAAMAIARALRRRNAVERQSSHSDDDSDHRVEALRLTARPALRYLLCQANIAAPTAGHNEQLLLAASLLVAVSGGIASVRSAAGVGGDRMALRLAVEDAIASQLGEEQHQALSVFEFVCGSLLRSALDITSPSDQGSPFRGGQTLWVASEVAFAGIASAHPTASGTHRSAPSRLRLQVHIAACANHAAGPWCIAESAVADACLQSVTACGGRASESILRMGGSTAAQFGVLGMCQWTARTLNATGILRCGVSAVPSAGCWQAQRAQPVASLMQAWANVAAGAAHVAVADASSSSTAHDSREGVLTLLLTLSAAVMQCTAAASTRCQQQPLSVADVTAVLSAVISLVKAAPLTRMDGESCELSCAQLRDVPAVHRLLTCRATAALAGMQLFLDCPYRSGDGAAVQALFGCHCAEGTSWIETLDNVVGVVFITIVTCVTVAVALSHSAGGTTAQRSSTEVSNETEEAIDGGGGQQPSASHAIALILGAVTRQLYRCMQRAFPADVPATTSVVAPAAWLSAFGTFLPAAFAAVNVIPSSSAAAESWLEHFRGPDVAVSLAADLLPAVEAAACRRDEFNCSGGRACHGEGHDGRQSLDDVAFVWRRFLDHSFCGHMGGGAW